VATAVGYIYRLLPITLNELCREQPALIIRTVNGDGRGNKYLFNENKSKR
jgi:hypothetical protein